MAVLSVAALTNTNYTLLDSTDTVAVARTSVPFDHVAIVTVRGLPAGVLPEDRLLALTETAQPLSTVRDRWLTPTLTQADTPLPVLLQAMAYSPSIRWHVVYDGNEIAGVVPPTALLALLAEWQQAPPSPLPAALATLLESVQGMTLGTMFNLPGNPQQPPPQLCALCDATTPPHRPQWHELDYANPLAPTCTVHPPTPVVWLNPCPGK